jgi:hypothetical protein
MPADLATDAIDQFETCLKNWLTDFTRGVQPQNRNREALAFIQENGQAVAWMADRYGLDRSPVLWVMRYLNAPGWTQKVAAAEENVEAVLLLLDDLRLKGSDGDNNASMRSVSEFIDGTRFKDINAVKRFLENHPEVPTAKPTSQRLMVHAGLFMAAVQAEKDRDFSAEKARSKRAAEYLARGAQSQQPSPRRRDAR